MIGKSAELFVFDLWPDNTDPEKEVLGRKGMLDEGSPSRLVPARWLPACADGVTLHSRLAVDENKGSNG